MGNWPAATRSDHQAFCVNEGWTHRPGDHEYYHLPLHDGRILFTKISRPVGRDTYGRDMWHQQILGQQLQVTEDEFWACVNDCVKPDRGEPEPPRETLPAGLVHLLKTRVGLSDEEIFKLSKAEAVDRMNEYWMAAGS
jgi:hypothetical protein